MMYLRNFIWMVGVFLLVLSFALQPQAASAEGSIALVDLEQALNSTDEGKKAREEIARKQREAEAQLRPMIEKYKKMEEELNAKKFVLSEEALYQKNLDLIEVQSQIESKGKELEGRLKVDHERLVGPLRKQLIEIVQSIGKDNGYSLILERATPGVIYAKEAIDITDLVIERFNKKG